MNRALAILLLALIILPLAACSDEGDKPPPSAVELTRDSIGYYCNMVVAEHMGPKGQIHLEGGAAPLWFSSVRDAIAFTMLPEEAKNIAAIYVNDMAVADWDSPGPGSWIEARGAWYVVGSAKAGGMGAPEAVPFSRQQAAHDFAAAHGGDVMEFAAVPEGFILGAVETPERNMTHMESDDVHEHDGPTQ